MITVLAGGTGSVKLVRGIASQTRDLSVISNVGDNYWLYGLYICPDIDTMLYGLADILDTERGWGIKKDTFGFLRQMEMLGEETWFKIGDRDAAIHLMRTNMLKNGKNLSDITEWMCQKFAVDTKIIPVTDNSVETRIVTNKGDLHLQEFWVKYKGQDKVEGIKYIGADKARANPAAVNAIHDSKLVVIAPGNPLTSIGPILSIKGIRKELAKSKKKVVIVSPLVGNAAISGPAAKYMEAAGIEVSVYGLAKMYSEVASHMIIDSADKLHTRKIENLDMKVYETKIRMKEKKDEEVLASFILKQMHV
ncbi:MAG TPA: 2-phospho-L-lactate transferase [Candidatus Nitrosotalea sp.]|nr:2-phospho-L-lactate transferase [Candidatus Nitrosotalea sp.]